MVSPAPTTARGQRGVDGPSRVRRPPAGRRTGIYGRQGTAGWLFVAPVVVILGVFLLLPILVALFVSLTKWNGQGSPMTKAGDWVGPPEGWVAPS